MSAHGDVVLPFGKFKGQTIDKVAETDEGLRYLDWMRGLGDLRPPHREALDAYLNDPAISEDLAKIVGDLQ